jgi:hypothetical protein
MYRAPHCIIISKALNYIRLLIVVAVPCLASPFCNLRLFPFTMPPFQTGPAPAVCQRSKVL